MLEPCSQAVIDIYHLAINQKYMERLPTTDTLFHQLIYHRLLSMTTWHNSSPSISRTKRICGIRSQFLAI
jgi:hypothetical protein